MRTLGDRIRQARGLASLSQQNLAERVGVQRSAVAQWERKDGSLPSMQHLIEIALATGVTLEWLGTGRGPVKPDAETWIPAVSGIDYAQDDTELECLRALRHLPHRVRENLAGIITLVAKNWPEEQS